MPKKPKPPLDLSEFPKLQRLIELLGQMPMDNAPVPMKAKPAKKRTAAPGQRKRPAK